MSGLFLYKYCRFNIYGFVKTRFLGFKNLLPNNKARNNNIKYIGKPRRADVNIASRNAVSVNRPSCWARNEAT